MHGHKESYKDLNLTPDRDSNSRPHAYGSDVLPTELSGDLMSRAQAKFLPMSGWG